MKYRIKESKNIFPCTVYMENQDYDEAYYYLDTPEYGLSWRSFDDVEQEDVENYKYIIKNIADLRKAIDDLEDDFIHGYGNSYFKLSENYMEDLLNRGKTLVRVKKEHKERVYIIRVKPAQNVELALAESFEKTIKSLQREGLFKNVKSFDLDFNGKGINIKLNESRPGNRNVSFKKRSNLKENESKAPLTDMVLDHMSQDGVLYDNWPYCCIDSAKFYDEVSENTGLDYDDVKDYCWDLVPDDLEIEDKLIELGSENYLLKKYGTLENLQKILDSDEGAEDVYNDLGRFDLSDYAYEAWADAIDTATSYIESRNHGYDEDDDEYSDED